MLGQDLGGAEGSHRILVPRLEAFQFRGEVRAPDPRMKASEPCRSLRAGILLVLAREHAARAEHRLGILHRSGRSEEHTSELQSLMRNSYAVFCLKKNNT